MTGLVGIEVALNKFADPNESISVRRRISHNIHIVILLHTIILLVAFRNTTYSILMTINYRYKFAPICCLITSTSGILYCILTLVYQWPIGLSCTLATPILYIFIVIGSVVNTLYLVERAYVAHRQSRVVFSIFSGYNTALIYDDIGMCRPILPSYSYFMRFIFDFGFSAVFFALFIHVAIQMYRRRRTNAWRKLVQNGIITMLLICATHLLFFVCTNLYLLGSVTIMLPITDWAVTMTLLVQYTRSMEKLQKDNYAASLVAY
ncbi:hypothetical protein BDF22DRAFT_774777 [Syncephalis plumigaleata]|nr:hypothetical protein BDF22DRAFT_774777 [Syncephalis plumigaleata]